MGTNDMSEELQKVLRETETKWGEIGYITFKRTYARRIKEDDKNSKTEEFWQTVKREIEASDKQLKVGFTDEEKIRYAQTRLQLKWSVAGRFMWQLGTKTVDKLGLPSLQNCFSADTEFVTSNGIRKFSDFNDGDSVVIKGNNSWKSATVKSFGNQDLVELTIKTISDNFEKVKTTLNHRWNIADTDGQRQSIKTTGELKEGMILETSSFDQKNIVPICKVVSVSEVISNEKVWCVVEPDNEEFTLANGILTKNCAFTVVNEPIRPFTWAFDMLMLGSGVGFNIQRHHVYQIPKVKNKIKIERVDEADADFIVPDTREGWVKLLAKILKAHFYSGEGFTYSTQLIRSKGAPIKGFGGLASGPEELCWGLAEISNILNNRSNKKIKPIDCLDIMNLIGSIVVSGNVRRCLPENSLVHTKRGLVKIQDIRINEDVALTSKGYSVIINKFEQGQQKTINIITQDGSFECTPNHRMAILTSVDEYKWVEAQHIKSGDRLISTREAIEGCTTSLPEWSYERCAKSTTCKDIIIPELDEDMSWLIGLFQADGYTYPNYKNNGFNAYISVVVGLNELNIAEKAQAQLKRFGSDLNVTLEKRKNENSYIIRCQSKQLSWYFDKNIKQSNTLLVIPKFIFESTENNRLSYLAGLADGDGSIHSRPMIVISTVYLEFAEQIQSLLYSCGIETRLSEGKEVKSRLGWQNIHTVSIITLYSREKFLNIPNLFKTAKSNLKSQNANGFPSKWINDSKVKRKYGLGIANQINIDSYEKEFGKVKLIPVEVTDIIEGRFINTWDIEVEEKNEFFCNGYLTHNSAQLAIGDYDDIEFLKSKRWDLGAIPNWRNMSNNSVAAPLNLNDLPKEYWETYTQGEPFGLINLDLSRKIGRTNETQYPDPDVEGFNPCAEQSLTDKESCCLAVVFLPNIHSYTELLEVLTLSYRMNKHSLSLHCSLKETEKIVNKNMRMGIGMAGYLQATEEQRSWLSDAYVWLREFDKKYSASHGFPISIKLTTEKPDGTQALLPSHVNKNGKILAGVILPGVHPNPAGEPYYIRRIRISSQSNLINVCVANGYPVEYQKNFDGTLDKTTMVVEFPCKLADGTPTAATFGWREQLDAVRRLQREWSDNSVSCTVYYKLEDLPEIKKYLAKHFSNEIKTVSFLLYHGHGFIQAPYETISKEEYTKRIKKCTPITTIEIKESDFELDECASGACPIK